MELDKKELIRQAAAEIIAQEGYHNTTVRMIAEEAGIAVGTIYLYFKTKEEILDYIFIVEHEKRIKYLDTLQKGNKNIVEIIEFFLDFHFIKLKESPSISKVLTQESLSPLMSDTKGIKNYWVEFPDILARMLDKAKQNGQIRDIDPMIVSRLIFYIIRNSVYIIQKDSDDSWIKKVKEQIVSLILNGIKK